MPMLQQIHYSKYCAWLLLLTTSLFVLMLYYYTSITRVNFNILRQSFNVPQRSLNVSQRPLNVSQRSLNVSQHFTTIYPYIAMIIDDRATPQLVAVVLNVLQHIPPDWKVQIFTHKEHWTFYEQSSLAPFIEHNRVFLTSIDFPRNNRSGSDFINLYLTSPLLWRRVQGEKVLYFQIDSVMCSNSSYKLTDFLHYDYIGAPWKVGGCCNGGFSIRSRTKILQLLESDRGRYTLRQANEDGWYAHNLPHFGGVVAPISVAKTFSVETIYHPRPFAVHNAHSYLSKEDTKRLCNECPEIKILSADCT